MSTRAPATGVSLPSGAFILTLPSIWVSPACASALVDNNAATAAHLIAILRGVLSIIPLPDQRRHLRRVNLPLVGCPDFGSLLDCRRQCLRPAQLPRLPVFDFP